MLVEVAKISLGPARIDLGELTLQYKDQSSRDPSVTIQTSLDGALASLEAAGWEREATFGIPHGPCCSFRAPGGHRIALYELTRPEAAAHFEGRRDF